MRHHGSVIEPANNSFFTPINQNRVSKSKLLVNSKISNQQVTDQSEICISPNMQNRKYMSPANKVYKDKSIFNDLSIDSNGDLFDVYNEMTLKSTGSTRNNTTLFCDKSNFTKNTSHIFNTSSSLKSKPKELSFGSGNLKNAFTKVNKNVFNKTNTSFQSPYSNKIKDGGIRSHNI